MFTYNDMTNINIPDLTRNNSASGFALKTESFYIVE